MSTLRRLFVVLIAGMLCAAFATRSFVSFERTRTRLIDRTVAPEGGVVRAASRELDGYAGRAQPSALVARISNSSAGTLSVVIVVDGAETCRVPLAAGETRRADCAVEQWGSPPGDHVVTVSGPVEGWRLDALEVATHHGSGRGLVSFVVLPAAASGYAKPPLLLAVALFIALTALLLGFRPASMPRPAGWLHATACAGIGAMFLAALLSPALSRFRVVFSSTTIALAALLLVLPQLWTLTPWVSRATARATPGRTIALRSGLVALLVVVLFGVLVRTQLWSLYHGNYSGFLSVSREKFDQNPILRERQDVRATLVLTDGGGYDGQFAYYQLFDPLMRTYAHAPASYRQVVDNVPYRYGRSGFPFLVRLVTMDRWRAYPAAMVALVLAGVFLSAFVLSAVAQQRQRPALLGALVVLIPGFWQSVQEALPEPMAAATLLAGYALAINGWGIVAGLCLALSLLIRETGIVMVVCLAAGLGLARRWREALTLTTVSIAPVMLWRLYVGWRLLPVEGSRGFLNHPDDLGWPFAGFLDTWQAISAGAYVDGTADVVRAGTLYPLLLIAGLVLAAALVIRARSAVNVAALIYAALAVCLNYAMIWVHVGNGQRGTYEMFVALALSLTVITNERRGLRLALTAFWCVAGLYTFYGAYDAGAIRAALLPGT